MAFQIVINKFLLLRLLIELKF